MIIDRQFSDSCALFAIDDNKPKAYFEVKEPVPDDNQIVNARQLPPAHEKQVMPPVIKNPVGYFHCSFCCTFILRDFSLIIIIKSS